MNITRIAIAVVAVLLAGVGFIAAASHATKAKGPLTATQDQDKLKPLQGAKASKTAKFGSVSKGDPLYTNALDAHDLAGTRKLIGKEGAFRGTVTSIFEERDGDLLILNFDPQYRNAMSAVLKNRDFSKFPDMKTLKGKDVVVSGRFVDYHGRAEIALTEPEQIKLVKE